MEKCSDVVTIFFADFLARLGLAGSDCTDSSDESAVVLVLSGGLADFRISGSDSRISGSALSSDLGEDAGSDIGDSLGLPPAPSSLSFCSSSSSATSLPEPDVATLDARGDEALVGPAPDGELLLPEDVAMTDDWSVDLEVVVV